MALSLDVLLKEAEAERAASTRAAGAELEKLGFGHTGEAAWEGLVRSADGKRQWAIRVRLPDQFPEALPQVQLLGAEAKAGYPHVDEGGSICIAPSPNLLLDVAHPRQLVRDALRLAASTLEMSDSPIAKIEVDREFEAYWRVGAADVAGIVDSDAPTHLAHACEVSGAIGRGNFRLLADSEEQAVAWAARLGAHTHTERPCYFLRLEGPPPFSGASEQFRAGTWLKAIKDRSSAEDVASMKAWLASIRLPATIVFSFPVPDSQLRGLCAIDLNPSGADRATAMSGGYRPHTVTGLREVWALRRSGLRKVRVDRLDGSYVRSRGGAQRLGDMRVVLVGCGAVGSLLAGKLAALGVGHLDLVDKEKLSAENIHRHYLGAESLLRSKAEAVAEQLNRRFPHQSAVAHGCSVEQFVKSDGELLEKANCIVLATGDESLERSLNRLFVGHGMRVHVWVEPLSVGGHVLRVPSGQATDRGCFECLYERVDEGANAGLLANMASFVAPLQRLTRQLAGCASTFTPFSFLDADKAAALAAEVVVSGLVMSPNEAGLWSWRGQSDLFEEMGLKLSLRGTKAVAGSTTRVRVGRLDCSACQRARGGAT